MTDFENSYIFISYAHKDVDIVLDIVSSMQQDGYNLWYDTGIAPGANWDDYIASKINTCSYFIAFISENYLNSTNCKDELNYARDHVDHILLVYLSDVALPAGMQMRLSLSQAINAYTYSHKVDFLDKLYSAEFINTCRDKFPPIKEPTATSKFNTNYYWENNAASAPAQTPIQSVNPISKPDPIQNIAPQYSEPVDSEEEKDNKLLKMQIIVGAAIALVVIIVIVAIAMKISSLNKQLNKDTNASTNASEQTTINTESTDSSEIIAPSVNGSTVATNETTAATTSATNSEATTSSSETTAATNSTLSEQDIRFNNYNLGYGYNRDNGNFFNFTNAPIAIDNDGNNTNGLYSSTSDVITIYINGAPGCNGEVVNVSWWKQNADGTYSQLYRVTEEPVVTEIGTYAYHSTMNYPESGRYVITWSDSSNTLTYWEIAVEKP